MPDIINDHRHYASLISSRYYVHSFVKVAHSPIFAVVNRKICKKFQIVNLAVALLFC